MGLATIADSLMTIKRLVFDERRFTIDEVIRICEENYTGHELLRQEILNRIPKFGNDIDEVDEIARRVCEILRDAVDTTPLPPDHIAVASMYSLTAHNRAGGRLIATPDGRLAGQPLSENHSPTYGMDRAGITALFKSIAKLPMAHMPSGGLNVKFAGKLPPEKLASLLQALFDKGGAVVGFTFVDKATLEDARAHPERYRSLLVRQTGFSEYFCSLPVHEQLEIINRTEY